MYDLKTLHIFAARAEEEDDEQEDMAYIALVTCELLKTPILAA